LPAALTITDRRLGAAVSGRMRSAVVREATDQALVARARQGDREAFEQLVVRHADRLHAVVRRLVRTDDDAREATQEAFLRAWRGIGRFKGDAEFFTWLYRIGINEANRLTTSSRTPGGAAPASFDGLVAEPRDPAPGPALATEHRALAEALDAALGELHPDYRTALVLRDIEGLSTEQAAAAMGLREAAFKSRLHRARMQVRTSIADLL
jgi:RNA polymerase sigma-70 factor, ECF subfamily